MESVNIKIGRKIFAISNDDQIYSNGCAYMLTSQTVFDGWHHSYPPVSKTLFNKLNKCGALKLIEKKFSYVAVNGKDMYEYRYRFVIENIPESMIIKD